MRWFREQKPEVQAIAAAVLFGASAPLTKLLLGQIQPVFLAGLLYLGSGIGLLPTRYVLHLRSENSHTEARLGKSDVLRVIGAMVTGGVAAPIVLMLGLKHTPAATASLLLNFEAVSTAFIAGVVFKEAIGRQVWIAIICITVAGAILSVDPNAAWGISIGALGILAACVLWGVDNNITSTISAKDPLTIVTIKSLGAGTFSVILALVLRNDIPSPGIIITTMVVGYFTYGLSIVLFILAMRGLGAARASTLFGTGPFVGAILSFFVFKSIPDLRFILALPLMIAGAAILLGEKHSHKHVHSAITHEHRHTHDDAHHQHLHSESDPEQPHSHMHLHDDVLHDHRHSPDMHHRHDHS